MEDEIIQNIFKNDEKITVDKLVNLREQLYSELYRYEVSLTYSIWLWTLIA